MDGLIWGIFVFAAFAGGFVSGFSGFAMGLVVSGAWLHIITPLQTAALIAAYGLLTQGYGIIKLRQALNWRAIWPLALGSALGIPVGVYLLTYINPLVLRSGVGAVLVLYSAYSLLRPAIGPFAIGTGGDLLIGFANGTLGGLTGLGGVISTMSCQWRGWPKDVQRGVFQPVLFAAFVVINVSMGFAGALTADTLRLYVIGLPFLLAGLWGGFKLYGAIDDETFRKTVLLLLLISGLSLILSATMWPGGKVGLAFGTDAANTLRIAPM
jgi:uncharacterized protein